jgi:hypothetical protein
MTLLLRITLMQRAILKDFRYPVHDWRYATQSSVTMWPCFILHLTHTHTHWMHCRSMCVPRNIITLFTKQHANASEPMFFDRVIQRRQIRDFEWIAEQKRNYGHVLGWWKNMIQLCSDLVLLSSSFNIFIQEGRYKCWWNVLRGLYSEYTIGLRGAASGHRVYVSRTCVTCVHV